MFNVECSMFLPFFEFDVPAPPGNAMRANLRSVYPDRSRRPSLLMPAPGRQKCAGLAPRLTAKRYLVGNQLD